MTLNIKHHGVEFTPALRSYVEEKMESLEKYASNLRHVDVEIGLSNRHHRKGEIFVCKAALQFSSHGDVMRIEKEEEDLYKAIDKVRDHLRAELSDRKPTLGNKIARET